MRKSDAPSFRPAPGLPGAAGPLRLSGTGRIGERLRVDPGYADGAAGSPLAFQWRRGGIDISGASGSEYVPGPRDDLALVNCRVTAAGPAGSVTVATAAIRITRAPPETSGVLREEAFGDGGDDWTVATAGTFRGEDLLFSVADAAAARIDPRRGTLSLRTDRARTGDVVTVRAENSGGSAENAFMITVEAAGEPARAAPSSGIFVDPGTGRDDARGTPEDPLRTVPAALAPGARVFLRRGSVYREPLVVASAGKAGAPVMIDFEAWGQASAPSALIDLSEPLTGLAAATPIGGASVLTADFPASVPRARWPETLMIQQDGSLMGLAQLPAPADPARSSDLDEWFDYDIYENTGSRETGWREWITAPRAFAEISGPKEGLLLRVWGWGNRTDIYEVADHDPATGRAEIVPYLHERALVPKADTRPARRKLAIINHPDCLKAEGQYLVDVAGSKLTLRPFGGGEGRFAVAAGGGASGIEIRAPHVELAGARVRMVASAGALSGGILARSAAGESLEGLRFLRCRVDDCMVAGAGMYLHGAGVAISNPLVEDCHVRNMLGESCRGIFLNGVERGMVRSCSADVTSSTGISGYTCRGTRFYGNVSGRPAGVHGNGFSFYEGCQDLLIAFNTVFQPRFGGMAMTMQSSGANAVIFNDFLTGEGNTVALYGPKDRYPERGGHVFANNNVLCVEEGKAFRIVAIPLWNDVPGQRIRAGEERRDPGDPEHKAWECSETNEGPDRPGMDFRRERVAHPGRWKLYGATGLGPSWPAGRPFFETRLMNNIVDGILSREIAQPNSYAVRTANMHVSSHSASTESDAVGGARHRRILAAGGKAGDLPRLADGRLLAGTTGLDGSAGGQRRALYRPGGHGRLGGPVAARGRRGHGRVGLAKRAALSPALSPVRAGSAAPGGPSRPCCAGSRRTRFPSRAITARTPCRTDADAPAAPERPAALRRSSCAPPAPAAWR